MEYYFTMDDDICCAWEFDKHFDNPQAVWRQHDDALARSMIFAQSLMFNEKKNPITHDSDALTEILLNGAMAIWSQLDSGPDKNYISKLLASNITGDLLRTQFLPFLR